MNVGSLSRASRTLVVVCVATAGGIAFIHRSQRVEREVRPSSSPPPGAAQRSCSAASASAAARCSACGARRWRVCTNPESRVRRRCCARRAQTLHAGVVRDEARLAAKRAQLAAQPSGQKQA